MENGGQWMNCYCWQTGENWVAVINPWYNESLNQDSQAAFIQTFLDLSYTAKVEEAWPSDGCDVNFQIQIINTYKL